MPFIERRVGVILFVCEELYLLVLFCICITVVLPTEIVTTASETQIPSGQLDTSDPNAW